MTITRHRILKWASMALVVAAVAACAGSTSLQSTHPRIVTGSSVERAKVYFIRPDPGFRGVMDRPATISLEGTELLSLAKGQYTVVQLAPGSAELKAESFTVVGTKNTMTPVWSTTQLTFSPLGTHYLVFELVFRGPLNGSVLVPRQVSRESALETVRGLAPVGNAVADPII